MHPRHARLIAHAEGLAAKLAAKAKAGTPKAKAGMPKAKTGGPTLYKYTDPDSGQDFYLPEKATKVRSPYSGKSVSGKPVKFSPGDVSKEMKSKTAVLFEALGVDSDEVPW
jgi:hypothetical protein